METKIKENELALIQKLELMSNFSGLTAEKAAIQYKLDKQILISQIMELYITYGIDPKVFRIDTKTGEIKKEETNESGKNS